MPTLEKSAAGHSTSSSLVALVIPQASFHCHRLPVSSEALSMQLALTEHLEACCLRGQHLQPIGLWQLKHLSQLGLSASRRRPLAPCCRAIDTMQKPMAWDSSCMVNQISLQCHLDWDWTEAVLHRR